MLHRLLLPNRRAFRMSAIGARLRLLPLPCAAPLGLAWHALRDRESREAALLRLRRPAGLFQPFGTTALDRYPRCFRYAQQVLGDGQERTLLSFGCSTGEEVFTLARYFPQATIRGIDINPRAITAARKQVPAADLARLSFAVAASANAEPESGYDAVFAMAVFRHGDLEVAPARCDHLIRFADFEAAVAGLARCLRPGGLLFLRHAHFRFADTRTAAGFEPALALDLDPNAAPGPLYGPDDRLLPGAPPVRDAAWRKRP